MSLLAALSAEKGRKGQTAAAAGTSLSSPASCAGSNSSSKQQSGSRKLQSALKISVNTFGKHILSFQHDSSEMHRVLRKLVHNLSIIDSVKSTKLNPLSNQFFEIFDRGMRDNVISQVMVECEGLLAQLRSFLRTLGDVAIAMKFTAQNAYHEVLDLDPSVFSGTIFNEDHMLSIQE